MKGATLTALTGLFTTFLSFSTLSFAQDISITAPAGSIIGQPGRLNSNVHEFLGIPYALPPIGPRRFEPPVRAPPSNTPISAKQFGFSCPAVFASYTSPLPVNLTGTEGEDCLSLNIWRRPGLQNAPVLVWFYGGGFIFGTSDTLLYDGTHFVAHNDVVMVTINYRTNVFGFPNSPALQHQNLGLMDQRVGLEWVRDNIAAFGGNPDQITIFGQSAGGASADIYSFAYQDDPIVKGLIQQSGAAPLVQLLGGGETFDAWNKLAAAAGCTGTDAEKLACMKTVPFQTLTDIMEPDQPGPGECPPTEGPAQGFGPRIDNKLVFSTEEYNRRGAAGQFAKIPVLTGITHEEFPPEGLLNPVPPGCPSPPSLIPGLPDTLPPELAAKLISAVGFVCPSRNAAQIRADHNVPVWRYRYFGSFNLSTTPPIDIGATHGSELPVLFGLADLIGNLPAKEKSILKEMQAAWTAFAKDPATGLSLAPFGWPKWSKGGLIKKNLVRLAYENEGTASFTGALQYDFWCDLLGLLPTTTTTKRLRGRSMRIMKRQDSGEEVALEIPAGISEEEVEIVQSLSEEELEALVNGVGMIVKGGF